VIIFLPFSFCISVTLTYPKWGRIDDVELTSFDGLGMIPIDILKQGSQKIVQYMLDLFRSPDAALSSAPN